VLPDEGAEVAKEGHLQDQKTPMGTGVVGKSGKNGERKTGQISMHRNGATMRSIGIDGKTQRIRRTSNSPNAKTIGRKLTSPEKRRRMRRLRRRQQRKGKNRHHQVKIRHLRRPRYLRRRQQHPRAPDAPRKQK
jgi:hypothetical protein